MSKGQKNVEKTKENIKEKEKGKAAEQVEKAVENLKLSEETVDETLPVKAKRKYDVVAEYENSKSKRKENSNLVVIGMLFLLHASMSWSLIYLKRSCGCW